MLNDKQKLEEELLVHKERLNNQEITKYDYYLIVTRIMDKIKEINRAKRQDAKKRAVLRNIVHTR